jgi:aldose 1-epimerase
VKALNTVTCIAAVLLLTFGLAGFASAAVKPASLAPDAKPGVFAREAVGAADGKEVSFYTVKNLNGVQATFTNLGATIVSVKTPDKNGRLEEVALGYDTLDGYLKDGSFFGNVVGRYANRIAHAKFTLDGKEYKLVPNEGDNQLHGGPEGFKTKVWDAAADGSTLVLTYLSPDGEMGYPGNLRAEVRYTLTDSNEIDIRISAVSDADTVVNLTNHSYWNLNGGGEGNILGHSLIINADTFTPTDEKLIPTGEFANVAGTPFDFRTVHKIGERIDEAHEAIKIGGGYDHNFMLNGRGLRKVVDLFESTSGRRLEIITDQPGMQMYTANGMNVPGGHDGVTYGDHGGVAFEAQFPPDCPNQPNFPSATLKAGETYKHHTIFKFSTDSGAVRTESAGEIDGKDVNWYVIENSYGMKLKLTNYGAAIASVAAPDREGRFEDVVLGYDSLDGYISDGSFFGFLVGRYANRIAGAQFELDGRTYKLTPNEGANQLHGGPEGFKTKVWDAAVDRNSVVMTYVSEDGEMGYPGTLIANVRYTLTDDNAVDVQIDATTDRDTVVNLTNHSYWNLNGAHDTILGHDLTIDAFAFTPTNEQLIPTGVYKDVTGTPFDFRTSHKIGERIAADDEAIKIGGGYDHNFMLNGAELKDLRRVAVCYDPKTGRQLDIFTDQPAMQMYTANGMNVANGKSGQLYGSNWGVAFETQLPPDCPNQPGFPDAALKAGDFYFHRTQFVLSAH